MALVGDTVNFGAHAKLPEQDRVVGVIVVGRGRDSDDVILAYNSVLYSN